MIITEINDITLVKGKKTFNFGDPPPPFFLPKIKNIPIHIIFPFFKISRFFKIEILCKKECFSLFISYKKGYIRQIFWDPPRFTTITVRYWFFHIDIFGVPWILHMQKLKKNHEAVFQTTTSSDLLKMMFIGSRVTHLSMNKSFFGNTKLYRCILNISLHRTYLFDNL